MRRGDWLGDREEILGGRARGCWNGNRRFKGDRSAKVREDVGRCRRVRGDRKGGKGAQID